MENIFRVLLTVAITALASISSYAQEIDMTKENLTIKDLESVKILVTEHPEAYADAVKAFEACDSTLTLTDVAIVYFGYQYTPEYHGGYYSTNVNAVKDLLEMGDNAGALEKVNEFRKTDPGCLRLLHYGINAIGDDDNPLRQQFITQFFSLCDCITTFGSGTADDPFKVIRVDDEYEILWAYLGVDEITQQSLTNSQCDAMEFKIRNVPFTLFFDVSDMLAFNYKQLTEHKEL